MFRWQATNSLVGPFMVVKPKPPCGTVLHLSDRVKLVLAQPAVSHCPIVTFDVGILLRVARLDCPEMRGLCFLYAAGSQADFQQSSPNWKKTRDQIPKRTSSTFWWPFLERRRPRNRHYLQQRSRYSRVRSAHAPARSCRTRSTSELLPRDASACEIYRRRLRPGLSYLESPHALGKGPGCHRRRDATGKH